MLKGVHFAFLFLPNEHAVVLNPKSIAFQNLLIIVQPILGTLEFYKMCSWGKWGKIGPKTNNVKGNVLSKITVNSSPKLLMGEVMNPR